MFSETFRERNVGTYTHRRIFVCRQVKTKTENRGILKVSLKVPPNVSLKAFLHARTRASLVFVELDKTARITIFEVKSPKSP